MLVCSVFILSTEAYGEKMFVYDNHSWRISQYDTGSFKVKKSINVKRLNYEKIPKVSKDDAKVRFSKKCGIAHFDKNKGIIRYFDVNTLQLTKTVNIPRSLYGKTG